MRGTWFIQRIPGCLWFLSIPFHQIVCVGVGPHLTKVFSSVVTFLTLSKLYILCAILYCMKILKKSENVKWLQMAQERAHHLLTGWATISYSRTLYHVVGSAKLYKNWSRSIFVCIRAAKYIEIFISASLYLWVPPPTAVAGVRFQVRLWWDLWRAKWLWGGFSPRTCFPCLFSCSHLLHIH
jgi:hypothetical protein